MTFSFLIIRCQVSQRFKLYVGFIPPTSGTAKVNGYDIREDITSVRGSLGLCPQHNILFDTMTVEEHLIFFAKVRFLIDHFSKCT